MIGVFDSGKGGLFAVREIRRLSGTADVCFLADTKNAPYGTKSREELIPLVSRDIERLTEKGASPILMACCTASTVYPYLSEKERALAIPIIEPTARAALGLSPKRIGVIATERTVRSRAFSRELFGLGFSGEVFELQTQALVSMVEGGASDGNITDGDREKISEALSPMMDFRPDVLILGCTHFSHIEREISALLCSVPTVSSAREGALEVLRRAPHLFGEGRTVYL